MLTEVWNAISLLHIRRRALGGDCTEFECWRIFVIVYCSASDKLAINSLVLLVWDVLSPIPPKREKEYLANCFQSKICELVSDRNSPIVYINTVIRTLQLHPALNECLLAR